MLIDFTPRKIYRGYRDDTGLHVTVNEQPLPHMLSDSDAALSILADHFEETLVTCNLLLMRCWSLHRAFKSDFLRRFKQQQWELTSLEIDQWVACLD